MALQCSISFYRNYAEVRALNDATLRPLKMDISDHYCRIFETTKLQCRDYIQEISRWANGRPVDLDNIVRSLMMDLSVRRRSIDRKR